MEATTGFFVVRERKRKKTETVILLGVYRRKVTLFQGTTRQLVSHNKGHLSYPEFFGPLALHSFKENTHRSCLAVIAGTALSPTDGSPRWEDVSITCQIS